MIKTTGKYYGGRATIWPKTELWNLAAFFLSQRAGRKISMKEVREAYKKWFGSPYCTTMSFAEFVTKLYSVSSPP